MRFDPLVEALALPADARVDQRVTKKLLLEQRAPRAADKRLIQEGIDELFWIAALKTNLIGVPAFRDEARAYLEIAVLTVALRPGANTARLVELIHRAIPYPLVLVAGHGDTVSLSLAHQRGSQGDPNHQERWTTEGDSPVDKAFSLSEGRARETLSEHGGTILQG